MTMTTSYLIGFQDKDMMLGECTQAAIIQVIIKYYCRRRFGKMHDGTFSNIKP